jgi:rhodanese-related sulfurtransferase
VSEKTQIDALSPEGIGLIAAVAGVYLAVRLLPRWIAAGSERISPRDLDRRLAGPTPPLLLDVRGALEAEQGGSIPGALNVPLDHLAAWLDTPGRSLDRQRQVITLCRTDTRAAFAARRLRRAGFRRTGLLIGGVDAWTGEGLPLGPPTSGAAGR